MYKITIQEKKIMKMLNELGFFIGIDEKRVIDPDNKNNKIKFENLFYDDIYYSKCYKCSYINIPKNYKNKNKNITECKNCKYSRLIRFYYYFNIVKKLSKNNIYTYENEDKKDYVYNKDSYILKI